MKLRKVKSVRFRINYLVRNFVIYADHVKL